MAHNKNVQAKRMVSLLLEGGADTGQYRGGEGGIGEDGVTVTGGWS